MEQQHNKGRLESFMAELGKKLDLLLDRARHETEEGKVAEKLDELRHTKEKLEKELHEFVQDDERWREVQHRLQGAAQELKKAFEITFRKKEGDGTTSSSGQQHTTSSQNPPAASGNAPGNAASGTPGALGAGGDTDIY
jgi:hypothetical protein